MNQLIEKCQEEADSIGGSVACVVRNCPIGWGEPCFDKLEAKLSHAMLSIPAAKAFELGSGFNGCALRGSVHNDLFVKMAGSPHLRTSTNHSGGIQGGISNGMPIYFRVGFKPPATIGKEQLTSDFSGELTILNARGRHDACVVPRAVPIVEAMTALVLADAALAQEARRNAANIAI